MRLHLIGALIIAVALAIGWVFGYFPNRVDDLAFVSVQRLPADGTRDNLRLRIRTSKNLRKLAEESGASGAWAQISFCPWRGNPSIWTNRVTHDGIDLGTKPTKGCLYEKGAFKGCYTRDDTPKVRAEIASTGQTTGPFIYDIDFGYHEQWLDYKSTYGGTTARRFPLPKAIRDLCVKVHGDGGPPGLQANIVVIPRAALSAALKGLRPEALDQKKWANDPTELKCDPRAFVHGQHLHLSFGQKHSPELAVHRLSDNTWWILVSADPPMGDTSLMTERAFSETTQLDLKSDVTGFQWWSSESKQEKIFASPGDYLVYLPPHGAENLETDRPGFGCLVHYSVL